MRRVVALLVVLLAAMSGCSSSGHRAAPPTTLPDPDVVPAVITPAYVDAVFVVLNHVASNASRTLAQARAVTTIVKTDLRAVFNDPVYGRQLQLAEEALTQGVIRNVNTAGGDPITVVVRLISATSSCIFAETRTNFSPIEVHSTPTPASEYYELRLKQSGMDPLGLNPTPWAVSGEQVFEVPTTVKSSCAAT